MKIIRILLTSSILLMMLSCKKEEGKGGKLSIKGSVTARYYSENLSKYTQKGPGADLDVYLVYGDNIGIGDKTKTDYQGNFEFKYLRSGNYKVYLFSKDTTGGSASEDISVVQNVDLISSVTLDPFVIALEDKRKLDEGKYRISGKLYANYYNKNYTVKTSSGFLADEEVYLIKDKSDPLVYIKETTMPDGSFVFTSLPAGDYTIYAMSEDTTHSSSTGKLVSQVKISITTAHASVGTIHVAKEDKTVGAYSVSGQIWAQFYDPTFSVKTVQSFLGDQDVFISLEGGTGYLDKTSTDLNGNFNFEELEAGKYIVYTYSGDTTKTSGTNEIVVRRNVEVSNSNVNVGLISIAKEDKRELDKGPYSISGIVNVRFCNSEFDNCRGPFPSPEFDVFISRAGENAYFDKITSGIGGHYTISELPNGEYTVYVVSKNELVVFDVNQPELITVKKQVTVNNGNVTGIDFELID